MKIKWTSEMHALLYSELVKQFGPYNTWGSTVPAAGRVEFDRFLKHMANHVTFVSGSETSPDAVEQQVAWAYTKQPLIAARFFRQYVSNKYWGMVTGFLDASEMPVEMLCDYSSKMVNVA